MHADPPAVEAGRIVPSPQLLHFGRVRIHRDDVQVRKPGQGLYQLPLFQAVGQTVPVADPGGAEDLVSLFVPGALGRKRSEGAGMDLWLRFLSAERVDPSFQRDGEEFVIGGDEARCHALYPGLPGKGGFPAIGRDSEGRNHVFAAGVESVSRLDEISACIDRALPERIDHPFLFLYHPVFPGLPVPLFLVVFDFPQAAQVEGGDGIAHAIQRLRGGDRDPAEPGEEGVAGRQVVEAG